MGKIVVSENVSLDGVVQDPTGEEGFDRGGWFLRISDADRAGWAGAGLEEAQRGEALLLGRRTEEYLAARWPSRAGAWADRLNGMPKYVVSATLGEPAWTNSTVLNGDPVTEAAKLKQELAGEIVVAGSIQLVHALLAHDLVDELRLMVFPVVVGAGRRMFGETAGALLMRLVSVRAIGDSLAQLTYQRTAGA
ncbi:MAG TPA: dihydrofolate reductase family protein [Trebonia sp.]